LSDEDVIKFLGQHPLERLEATIQRAYNFGESFIENHQFLNVPSAKCFWQNILNFSVDYNIMNYCKKDIPEYKYEFLKNKAQNCEHLELDNGNIVLTISSSNNTNGLPRVCHFRIHHAYSNQLTWFNKPETSPRYGIIIHRRKGEKAEGNKNIVEVKKAEVILGIPDADYLSWAHYINLADICKVDKKLITTEEDNEYNNFDMALRKELNISTE
jgi:hypothetical protein